MVITSKNNEFVKRLKKLADKKYRAKFGEYIAEGERWVRDARRICPQNVVAAVCAQSYSCEFADVVLPDALFAEIADTESSQGIFAVMKISPHNNEYGSDCCLFLDRVRDPGNLGTIIRTACAAGFGDIVLRDCVDVYNPKVIRSSMTGILGVNLHYCDNLSEVKQNGYTVFAAAAGGTDVFKYRGNAKKICLVIGNEANGIDRLIFDECDCTLAIPMTDKMESLNAAISAAVLMYQLKYNYKEN